MRKYTLGNWSKQIMSAFVTYQSFMYTAFSKLCHDVGRHGCEIPNLLFYEADRCISLFISRGDNKYVSLGTCNRLNFSGV